MDYEYWLRLGERGVKFAFLEEKLAGSRMYLANKTMANRVSVHAEVCSMLRNKFAKVELSWLVSYADVVASKFFGEGPTKRRAKKVLIAFAEARWNRKFPG